MGKADNDKINIAIDGPAGAGKSTIARLVANELNYLYVDTGAMYRAVALKVIEAKMSLQAEDEIAKLTEGLTIELVPGTEGQHVFVNGQEVTERIRRQDVNRIVAQIAQIEKVRALLVKKQKQIALAKGVVMDGRDITTRVLPDAEVKIYLTASVEERARRRFAELKDQSGITLKQLEQEISHRDELDKNREISPLLIAADAFVLDCTEMSIQQVIDIILQQTRTKLLRE